MGSGQPPPLPAAALGRAQRPADRRGARDLTPRCPCAARSDPAGRLAGCPTTRTPSPRPPAPCSRRSPRSPPTSTCTRSWSGSCGRHRADRGEVRRPRRDRQRLLARRVRDHRPDRGGAGPDRRPAARSRDPRPADPPPRADPARRPHPAPRLGRLPAEPPADEVLPRGAGPDPRHRLRQPLPDREGRRGVLHPAGPAARRGARQRGRVRDRQRPRLRAERAPTPVAGVVLGAVRGTAAADRGEPGAGRVRAGRARDGGVGRGRRAPARGRATVAPDPADPEVAAALALLDGVPWPDPDTFPVDLPLGSFTAVLVPLRTHLVPGGLLVLLFEDGSPRCPTRSAACWGRSPTRPPSRSTGPRPSRTGPSSR